MVSAQDGHTATVQALLDAGADVNTKSKFGWTALGLAAKEGHTAVVQLLKKAGAKE
jgi:ankyrin repeat protein